MTDARKRALRTAAQNLAFDVALAVVVVIAPLIGGTELAAINWGAVGLTALKTAVVTALAWLHRHLEELRA